MRTGEVIGTQTPTGHSVLIDARFELPYGKYSALLFYNILCTKIINSNKKY